MVTSSNNEKITKSEVKVSSFCQFNTTLPEDEGNYGFFVSVSPGGRTLSVEDKLVAVGKEMYIFVFKVTFNKNHKSSTQTQAS